MNTVETDKQIQEASHKVKEPSLYQVVMHKDDYTPMDFVVAALETFFHMDKNKAVQITLQIRTLGKAVCGIYTKDIAVTKIDEVVDHARRHEHPLLCSIEGT